MTDDIVSSTTEAFGTGMIPLEPHKLDPTHLRILVICHDTPDAINDRPLLLAKFYENDWDNSKTLYQNFSRLTRPETVSRRFRDLREWGYVKQSKEADDYNYKAMQSERDRHSPIPPQFTLYGGAPEEIVYGDTARKSYYNQEHLFTLEDKESYD